VAAGFGLGLAQPELVKSKLFFTIFRFLGFYVLKVFRINLQMPDTKLGSTGKNSAM